LINDWYQSQVAILGPVGYGPTTLPLRRVPAGRAGPLLGAPSVGRAGPFGRAPCTNDKWSILGRFSFGFPLSFVFFYEFQLFFAFKFTLLLLLSLITVLSSVMNLQKLFILRCWCCDYSLKFKFQSTNIP
jgi:hypothetical protein